MAINRSFYEVLTIEANDQSQVADLVNGAVSFDYYEDIFSPTVTAKLTIVNVGDTVGPNKKRRSLYHGLPLRGGERLAVKIAPNSENIKKPFDFSQPDQYFFVSGISEANIQENKESFTLNLISREAITNETSRVGKKFNRELKISDSVTQILEEYLFTDNINIVETTSNTYPFIGNLKKPFTVLVNLAPKSIPATNKGNAGFVFYQTQDGFNFRSLDALIGQSAKAVYTHAPGYANFEGSAKVDNEYKILNYYIDRNEDLIEKLRIGAYASERYYFDPLSFNITEAGLRPFNQSIYRRSVKTLGSKLKLPQMGNGVSLGDSPSRIITQILDRGTLDPEINKDLMQDPLDYQSQSLMRYNTLLTQTLSVVVPLNSDLRAGDVIECRFPLLVNNPDVNEYDDKTTGLYMIKELCHHYDSERSYTSMKLLRDTYS